MSTTPRRQFLRSAMGATAAAIGIPQVRAQAAPVLGQGEFRYRVMPDWGVLGPETPVKNCHGMVQDREGHLILFNTDTSNNVIIYDKAGKLVNKWGTDYPGAHGLSIVTEGSREVLFLTDLQRHQVIKTTLDGEVLHVWDWPEVSGKYEKAADYKPSWTLHLPEGDFFVLDGYGKDFITRYDAAGKYAGVFGGAEGGIVHWGPHGGMADLREGQPPTLLIAMSDQQYLLRLSLSGEILQRIDLAGGNPRQIRQHKGHYFMAHLADNWPKDRQSRGFISVLNADLKVVSNIAGTAPVYDDAGKLQPMRHQEEVFIHPHDLIVDDEDSLYVAQFASNNTYPIKLERV